MIKIISIELLLISAIFAGNNRLSLSIGEPDLIGLEYQRYFNIFYLGFSPHVLSSILFCNVQNEEYDIAIFPNLSLGHRFFKRNKFDLAYDIVFTPAYFKRTNQFNYQYDYFQFWSAVRIIPSLSFSNIIYSLGCGCLYMYNFNNEHNYLFPSAVFKIGQDF